MDYAPQPPEHAADNAANRTTDGSRRRAALRREKIAARMALSPEEHARLSALVEGHLARELAGRKPGLLAFCWPIRMEFDSRPLVTRLLATGWRACMPVVEKTDAPLIFRPWTPATTMTFDPFGIPVPQAGAASPPPELLLVPLVAFDDAGFRLGYGGGYFDRTLASLVPRPEAWGVGFELARTADVDPQSHDIPLDAIATESGLVRTGPFGPSPSAGNPPRQLR